MAMPMVGMPSNWKAEGLLGGLYGGMQAQYQSDAMRDATRQADLDYAIKNYDFGEKQLDAPVREAQRTAEITKAKEYNTLSPTRIEDAQLGLQDKKWSFEEKKRISQTAQQAEFFAGVSQALEPHLGPDGGGRLSQGYRDAWKSAYEEGKKLGIDIGQEWSMDNEARLRGNASKAVNSLPQLRQLQLISHKGDIDERSKVQDRASNEGIHERDRITKELIAAQGEENANYRARLGADSRLAAAEARAAASGEREPRSMGELQARVELKAMQTPGKITKEELAFLARMRGLSLAKILGGDPGVQLARLSADPKLYEAKVMEVMQVINSAGEAPATSQASTPTGSSPQKFPGGVTVREVPRANQVPQ